MNTLFWIYKQRLNAAGEAPLMLRLTHDGKRVNVSLNTFINAKQWDAKRQKVKGSNEYAKELNSLLNTHLSKAVKSYGELLKAGALFSVEQLRDHFLDKDKVRMYLMEAFKQHNAQVKKKIGVGYTIGTWKKYQTCYNKLHKFIISKKKRQDLLLQEMDRKLIQDFDFYLRTDGNCQHNTVLKNMQQIKKVVKWCRQNGWIEHDPFELYQFKLKETVRSYLTFDEINRMRKAVLHSDRLREVRDVFIFQCFSGLAHIDVLNLQSSDIIIGIDGRKWLQLNRAKTGTLMRVPLLGPTEEIINRYRDHPRCKTKGTLLPVISNQPMNRALKEIAAIAGIEKSISSHTGRHSFATSVTAGHGVPIVENPVILTTLIRCKLTSLC